MGTFFRELVHVGIYKASQGRIARQITFAALALTIALGLLRLGGLLVSLDPIITALPAQVTCTTKAGHLEADAKIKVTGAAGSAVVAIQANERLTKVAEAIAALRPTTGVEASMSDNKLVLSSVVVGAKGTNTTQCRRACGRRKAWGPAASPAAETP